MRRTAVVSGLLTAATGVVLDRSGGWGWAPEWTDATWPVVALLALAVAAVASLAANPPVRRLAAVVALGALAGIGFVVVDAVRSGLPGPSTGVLAAGCAVAGLAAAARAVRAHRVRGTVARTVALVTVPLVTAALAVACGALVDDVLVRSDVAASAASDPGPVVLRPGPERWRWTSPQRVDDVVPVAAGVAVLRGDEVVALDGATGRERWTFRRAGASEQTLTVSPDGRTVVVVDDLPGPAQLVTVLDAGSGERRWDTVLTGRFGEPFQLSDRVLTVLRELPGSESRSSDDRFRVEARSLADGTGVWGWEPPAGCEIGLPGLLDRGSSAPVVRSADVVVGWQDCGRSRIGTGLDDRTGAVRWTLPPVAFASESGRGTWETVPVSTPDARAVLFYPAPGGATVVEPASGRVVGRVPGLGRFDLARSRPSQTRALVLAERPGTGGVNVPVGAVDPVTGTVSPLPVECVDRAGRVAVTSGPGPGAMLRLCGRAPAYGLREGDGPLLGLDPGPPVLDPLDVTDLGLVGRPSEHLLVPAPGALVVGTTFSEPATLVGFGPGR